jgi:hypothetical protein
VPRAPGPLRVHVANAAVVAAASPSGSSGFPAIAVGLFVACVLALVAVGLARVRGTSRGQDARLRGARGQSSAAPNTVTASTREAAFPKSAACRRHR